MSDPVEIIYEALTEICAAFSQRPQHRIDRLTLLAYPQGEWVELDEILGLSDRILVMNKGQEVSTVNGDDANPKDLGLMMAGISQGASN